MNEDPVVSQLLVLYASTVLINVAISAALWAGSRNPLFRTLFAAWAATVASMAAQGVLAHGQLQVIVGFSSAFAVNLIYSRLLCRTSNTELGWRPFVAALAVALALSAGLTLAGGSFTVAALPTAIAVALPCGVATVIVPGDNEAPSWKALREVPEFARRLANCHLFLTSHHGRESGYCDTTFPALLQPRLCIVSDGPTRETNATPKYGDRVPVPHPVILGSGKVVQRRCVTTRDDGVVIALIEQRPDGTFVRVKVGNG